VNHHELSCPSSAAGPAASLPASDAGAGTWADGQASGDQPADELAGLMIIAGRGGDDQGMTRGRRPGVMSLHQAELEAGWLQLFTEHGFVAMSFVTFTFDPKRWQSISPYKAMALFKWWLGMVNRELGGHDYKRKCKHSLLSYAVGVDYHSSGDVHLHAVIDGWFDYSSARKLWGSRCGFLDTEEVRDPVASLQHVLKYIRKADDFGPAVWFHRSPVRHPPADRLREGQLASGGACQG